MEELVIICGCGRTLPEGNLDGYECPCGVCYWGYLNPWAQLTSNTWVKTV